MTILAALSSQTGDKTEASNKAVAKQCLDKPALLKSLAAGLKSDDTGLVTDCAEVMTLVAQSNPKQIAPYATELVDLLDSKVTKTRFEAMHALALVADRAPKPVTKVLEKIHRMSLSDKSTIVRDYAVTLFGTYALSGARAANHVFPLLQSVLKVWGEKQAARVMTGLANVACADRNLAPRIDKIIAPYLDSPKAGVRKAAKDAAKTMKRLELR